MRHTTRAYDPALGRFLARDPLGRVPLYFADNSQRNDHRERG